MKDSDRLTYRPVVGGEEVEKTTTIWRAESITKMITLTTVIMCKQRRSNCAGQAATCFGTFQVFH